MTCSTAIVGDITPADNVSKEEKNRLETAAIKEMCQLLEGGIAGILSSENYMTSVTLRLLCC